MNRVVIITGSRRGLGEATAYQFAKCGYDVVINDKEDKTSINRVVEKIKSEYGVEAIGILADVSDEENVKNLLKTVDDKFGRIDVLVNNAAIVYDMDLEDRDSKIFNETILNNLTSTYLMSKYIGKYMFDNTEGGKIVNVSSTNGINTFFPTSIDYDATKDGVISMTHNFALEYAPKVLVNSVAPGWINTEMNADLPDDLVREETEKIYLKRFAEPEEIAGLIYFLSSEANTYINGEIIKIDGGY